MPFLEHSCPVILTGNCFIKAKMVHMNTQSVPGHQLLQQVYPSGSCHSTNFRLSVLTCGLQIMVSCKLSQQLITVWIIYSFIFFFPPSAVFI